MTHISEHPASLLYQTQFTPCSLLDVVKASPVEDVDHVLCRIQDLLGNLLGIEEADKAPDHLLLELELNLNPKPFFLE